MVRTMSAVGARIPRVTQMLCLPLVLSLVLASTTEAAALQDQTLEAFERYVALTEARIDEELEVGSSTAASPFLVVDRLPRGESAEVYDRLRSGEIEKRKLETVDADGRAIEVPKGMVHHWVGDVFVPGATLDELMGFITDYDEHERYFDEVESSKLLSRTGDSYEIFLRLRRKKVITVHYNTEHEVVYRHHGPGRISSRSYATRIAEVADAGTADEREKPPGDDRGFLWRLNSYWRFKAVEGGVIVECETISLSRSIPAAFRWLVGRYIDSVPKESLEATLAPIRGAYEDGTKRTLVQSSSLASKIR